MDHKKYISTKEYVAKIQQVTLLLESVQAFQVNTKRKVETLLQTNDQITENVKSYGQEKMSNKQLLGYILR